MARHKNEYPDRDELVIGTIVNINPFSALVKLDEYPGKEGMVHISEVARRIVRDIRKFVKAGQKKAFRILRIDRKKNHIMLSLKRVTEHESDERMKKAKREQKAEKMLEAAGKKLNIDLDKSYEQAGFLLQENFGEMFKAFKTALSDDGYDSLIKRGVPENWAKAIKETAEEMMELKEKELKGVIELKSYAPDGIEIIKRILTEAEEKGAKINYISAPKYSIIIKTKDPKKGEKKLNEITDEILKKIKAEKGEGSFTRSD